MVTGNGYGCKESCGRERTNSDRLPWDSEEVYGGWGGTWTTTSADDVLSTENTPIVFVHGNGRDACDWLSFRDYFLQRGYEPSDLWAITFSEPTTTHDSMAAELDEFVSHVRECVGNEEIALVGHSLGVTGIRHWVNSRDRHDYVESIVGLVGANHGVKPMSPFPDSEYTEPFEYLNANQLGDEDHGLTKLNAGTETPGEIRYYTIRGKYDPFFAANPTSPKLEGAEENRIVWRDHDGVRTSQKSKRLVYKWTTAE